MGNYAKAPLPSLSWPRGRQGEEEREREKLRKRKTAKKGDLKWGRRTRVRRSPSPSTSTTTILSRSVTTVIAKGQKVFFCCPPPRSPLPSFCSQSSSRFPFFSSASLPLGGVSFHACLFLFCRDEEEALLSRESVFFLLRARDILSGINHSVAAATQTEMGDGESDPPLSSHIKRPPETINISIDGAQLSLFHIR